MEGYDERRNCKVHAEMIHALKVITIDRTTLIVNRSETHRVLMFTIPKPPKRKIVLIRQIEVESFVSFENYIDLDSVLFKFQFVKTKLKLKNDKNKVVLSGRKIAEVI